MSNDHTQQTDFDRADAGITARREAALKAHAERSGGLNTRAIHAGYTPDGQTGAINVPIYASTTYAQDGVNQLRGGFEYGRVGNPTFTALEQAVASLEGGAFGRAYASGMAATDTILRALLRPGSHIVLGDDAYGGTFRLIDVTFSQWGVEHTVVDTTNPENVAAALQDNTAVVWLETPTNPLLSITDIRAVKDAMGDHPAKLVVDNTFASPYLQRPLDLGADVVLHSTTKYLGGHSDVVGGVLVLNDAELDAELLFLQGGVGAVPSPFDAYLVYRGIKTLGVRMDRHCANAQAVAEFFEAHPKVKKVYYPGLKSHKGHDVAARQMSGFGGMVSIELESEEKAKAFCEATELFCLAESLGGVESLLEHPTSMTHQSAVGSALEVPRELGRISVGIEDVEDLIADLEQALDRI